MNCQLLLLLITALASATESSSCSCANPLTCKDFVGWNKCRFVDSCEPALPPLANTCCGPSCVYTAPLTVSSKCNSTASGVCLLDTTCSSGPPFQYVIISSCDLIKANECRLKEKYPLLLSFNYNKAVCESLNQKCGLNCCCRETCPQQFCTIGKK